MNQTWFQGQRLQPIAEIKLKIIHTKRTGQRQFTCLFRIYLSFIFIIVMYKLSLIIHPHKLIKNV